MTVVVPYEDPRDLKYWAMPFCICHSQPRWHSARDIRLSRWSAAPDVVHKYLVALHRNLLCAEHLCRSYTPLVDKLKRHAH